ncbi:uncharacterized protein LOC122529610 isoform X1 [Frieseomelitta varia]|uniref:uncharacterized protein LOC122529610 isoform X1 n=1 Tax=Frieseomelitta varia TaxID=561572 RepID=UPI001CB69296|nr:uncharacterized protein LOC122529610 isoform X1 [Frieseomelitta varia]
MSPYLTRKRAASTRSSKETQLSDKDTVPKMTSKTRSVINKTLKLKGHAKVTNAESMYQTQRTRNRKGNTSVSQTEKNVQKERQKRTRSNDLSKDDIKDTVKSKKVVTHSSSEIKKKDIRTEKRKVITKITRNTSNSKQTSLKEAFLNQSKVRILRSHKNSTNDKSTKKLISPKKKKVPVYKCISPEKSKESTNEIYEFKFDINDSTERVPKKRKKRAVKKTTTNKRRRNVSVKQINTKQLTKSKRVKGVNVKFEENNPVELSSKDKNDVLKTDIVETGVELDKEMKDSGNITGEENANTIKKPTIISVEDLSNRRISIVGTSQTSTSPDFKPFRPTNIFNNRLTAQKKDALNFSLFEKSLSPIVKSTENLQIPPSPWRVASLYGFSQVNNVFQSTPQNNKYDIVNKKISRVNNEVLNNESKQFGNITKMKNNWQKNNENMSAGKHVHINTKTRNPLTPRKFGTEITNLDHSVQIKSSIEQTSEQISTKTETNQLNADSTNVIISNVSKFDNNENKTINISSPRKSFKKGIIKVKQGGKVDKEENFDPQPGSSDLQSSIPNEERLLKQSNLNNFLNIMETPQNTIIKTAHGIFDDVQSTSITSKANVSTILLKDTFDFSDDSNQESPIKDKDNKKEKFTQRNTELCNIKPIRLSIGEIKNKLLTKELKEDIHNKENILIKKKKVKKSPIERRNKHKHVDIVNFSDTFDILSETGETSAASANSVPLFADLEPSHFTEPPRYSYKRKRATKISYSDDESDEEEKRITENEIKRKKTNKLKKDQEERLVEWIENINKTFNEVDKYELVIDRNA